MAFCTELEFPIGYVADRLAYAVGGQSSPRSVGWHISSIIKASEEIAKGKTVDPEYYYCSEDSPDMEGLENEIPEGILDMGNLWEAACRPAFVEWCEFRFGLPATGPMQGEKDGIIANADALVLSKDHQTVVAIGECKFKYSPNTDPQINRAWMQQIKGYCHLWQTNMVLMAIGNVRQSPPGSKSRIYMLQFTPGEIAENWQMLVNVRDYLDRARQELIENQLLAAADELDLDTVNPDPNHVHDFVRFESGDALRSCAFNDDMGMSTPHGYEDAVAYCVPCSLAVCAGCADQLQQEAKDQSLVHSGPSPHQFSLFPGDVDDLPF